MGECVFKVNVKLHCTKILISIHSQTCTEPIPICISIGTCNGFGYMILYLGKGYYLELLIGTRESKDSRLQAGLASPSPAFRLSWSLQVYLLKLRRSSIGLAGPRVPAGPRQL